ncbi:STE3-domain-containing protein [Peniophora sp. CONT]|nr:STE3-domain-containing protein [Peniophora sp. CONT]
MAAAVDPSYPLYPIACILAAAMLLLVLLTSFIRQRWNRGVAFLCFWLFFENLTGGINTILWADNADIKLYAYCDIGKDKLTDNTTVSRLQVMTSVVKPMATLIITRRLYLMASLQPVELPGEKMRRNLVIEWTLGLVIPPAGCTELLQDYIVQLLRFEVVEGFGCQDAQDNSILALLLVNSWSIIPPLLSIVIYYPRVILTFYRQSRDRDNFLQAQSNGAVSRTNYTRILILASIDILLTLPIGIATVVLNVIGILASGPLPFYSGWTYVHTAWEPVGFSYAGLKAFGTSELAQYYFTQWTSPILAYVIFALFGMTSEARASYWRIICITGAWFGSEPKTRTPRGLSSPGIVDIDTPLHEMSLDAELRCVLLIRHELARLTVSRRQSGLIDSGSQASKPTARSASKSTWREREGSWETDIAEEFLGYRDIHGIACVDSTRYLCAAKLTPRVTYSTV